MNAEDWYISARFWSKVKVGDPTECWPWTAARHVFGYGRFKIRGKLFSPHRVAFEFANGDIPDPDNDAYHGTVIRHKCDNPECCNPHHLEPGSQKDNVADMLIRTQAKKWARLTPEQVEEIRKDPRSQREIAKDYGVSKSHIGRIKSGAAWVPFHKGVPRP